MNSYCKHGYHHAIRCFQCEQERIAGAIMRPIEKQLSNNERREQAIKKIHEAAKRLDW